MWFLGIIEEDVLDLERGDLESKEEDEVLQLDFTFITVSEILDKLLVLLKSFVILQVFIIEALALLFNLEAF